MDGWVDGYVEDFRTSEMRNDSSGHVLPHEWNEWMDQEWDRRKGRAEQDGAGESSLCIHSVIQWLEGNGNSVHRNFWT